MRTSERAVAVAAASPAAEKAAARGEREGSPEERPSAHRPRLGELLLAEGLVTDAAIEAALDEQRRTGGRLGDVLLARGAVSPPDLTRVLGLHYGVEFVDLDEYPI